MQLSKFGILFDKMYDKTTENTFIKLNSKDFFVEFYLTVNKIKDIIAIVRLVITPNEK